MTRTLVMGDPQGPFDKLLAVLDQHAALDGDRLARDVVLVSIGDHFDYDIHDWQTPGQGGRWFLGWLGRHLAGAPRPGAGGAAARQPRYRAGHGDGGDKRRAVRRSAIPGVDAPRRSGAR